MVGHGKNKKISFFLCGFLFVCVRGLVGFFLLVVFFFAVVAVVLGTVLLAGMLGLIM